MDAKKRETPAISDRGFTFGLHFGTTHRMPGKPGQHTTVTAPQTASAQPLACGSDPAALGPLPGSSVGTEPPPYTYDLFTK